LKYVVGDIHGEITKLKNLIQKISNIDTKPEFIFIGDYIDKGENAKATLDYLDLFRKNFPCVFLLGNHEYFWKQAEKNLNYLLNYGAKSTIHSFGFSDLVETKNFLFDRYKDLFNLMTDYYIVDAYFISHSGIDPQKYFTNDLNEIPTISFLFNRYSFIKEESYFQKKYKVIFGHTAFYKPYYDLYKIGIDTAACYLLSQPLTAFCIDNSMFINSHGQQYNLDSLPINACANIVRNKTNLIL